MILHVKASLRGVLQRADNGRFERVRCAHTCAQKSSGDHGHESLGVEPGAELHADGAGHTRACAAVRLRRKFNR